MRERARRPRGGRARRSRGTEPEAATRRAGLLLHPTSLPGPFPIGDLGPAAHSLLDWLVEAGLSTWQLLPLGPTGYGDSPYHALSSFAGNPLLVSPEALVAEGLLSADDLHPPKVERQDKADFSQAKDFKQRLHRRVWRELAAALELRGDDRARRGRSAQRARRFEATTEATTKAFREGKVSSASAARDAAASKPEGFSLSGKSSALESLSLQWKSFVSDPEIRAWLEDWSLFAALKERFGGGTWLEWDPELRDRKPGALAKARRELADEISFHAFEQFLFFSQWTALRGAAEARGVELVGDLPIYPALDSADVWANRRLFQLARDGRPRRVAGVPPDYFSETGQLWGNPLYRWEALAERRFDWWVARVRWQLRLVHRLRLDHFRGFVAYWDVSARAATAAKGRWSPGPGRALFDALARALGGRLPLLVEDLGDVDEPVHALRRKLRLPGMRVLQFGFSEDDSLHAPHRHEPDNAVYTGTHDNDTSRGWLATAPDETKQRVLLYLGATEESFGWSMVRAAMASPADLAIVPLQDLLGLGSEARMNKPAKESGNWTWRVKGEQVPADLPARLRELVAATSRIPPEKAKSSEK